MKGPILLVNSGRFWPVGPGYASLDCRSSSLETVCNGGGWLIGSDCLTRTGEPGPGLIPDHYRGFPVEF